MIGQWNPVNIFAGLLRQAIQGSPNVAKNITAERALSYAPIWYGVNKIGGHIAQLPLCVYKRLERGAERDRMHPVSRLLRKPNEYQTPTIHREQIAIHSILQGNGRAAIVREGSMIKELIPLLPDYTATGMLAGIKIHATRPPIDDRLRLFVDAVDEGDDEGVIMLSDADVVHIPGLTMDGVCGLPLIVAARKNLLISLGTEERLSSQMQNGFQGNIMLQAPAGVFRKEKEAQEFLEAFEKRHHDPAKAGKPGLLREGITANLMAMNNTDAQFIDQRLFQRQDAALWLGLEQILGDDSSVSYNSLEQKNLAYLMNTLNRWLKRWEEELERKLLPANQFRDESYFIRFNTAALLKSDYKTSIEALSQAITSTIISPNEAREKLDMNPYDGGDTYSNPAITVGSTPTDDEPEPDDDDSPADRAVASRLEHLIQVESNRVTAGTKHANYVAWLDRFYDKWEPKLSVWLDELGLDEELATTYCESSKTQLLEVCGVSTSATLGQNIELCVSDWKDRATQLIEADHVCV